ncbi:MULTISPECIES: helix-turn-helix domain-containing protein [unclassified Luteococcus]|uniref:helix-turn-helix domain-containing protein n=1 Tax=unclassified Luteococcus TaxID=2639923 RepID=UPI00313AC0E8
MGRASKVNTDSIDSHAWQIIWELAQQQGIDTKAELARRAHNERSQVSRYISGEKIASLDETSKAAAAIGMSLPNLIAMAERQRDRGSRFVADDEDGRYRE